MNVFVVKRGGIYELRDISVIGIFDDSEKAIDYAKEMKANDGDYYLAVLKFTLNQGISIHSEENAIFCTDNGYYLINNQNEKLQKNATKAKESLQKGV